MRMRMAVTVRVVVIVGVMIVDRMAVVVIVHQLLGHVGKQLSRRRRAAAGPFDAAVLARRSQQVIPGQCGWIASDVESLRQRREHELPNAPAIPPVAQRRELRNARAIPAERQQRRPLHRQLAERVVENALNGLAVGQRADHGCARSQE